MKIIINEFGAASTEFPVTLTYAKSYVDKFFIVDVDDEPIDVEDMGYAYWSVSLYADYDRTACLMKVPVTGPVVNEFSVDIGVFDPRLFGWLGGRDVKACFMAIEGADEPGGALYHPMFPVTVRCSENFELPVDLHKALLAELQTAVQRARDAAVDAAAAASSAQGIDDRAVAAAEAAEASARDASDEAVEAGRQATAAENAKDAAVAAQDLAEDARDDATAAKNAAVNAQSQAEAARDRAETAAAKIPAPTAQDAGKVPAVNQQGTAYELKDISQFTGISGVSINGVAALVEDGVAQVSAVTDVTVDGQSVVENGVASITIPASAQADWNVTDTTSPAYIKNKPALNFVPLTRTVNSKALNADITLTASDVGAPTVAATGAVLGLSIDPLTYVMTMQLKNASNEVLDTQTVDLPLESMVISASYADGTLTLTLQSGDTLEVDISAIVSGLVPTSDVGAANGVAPLDANGKVPNSNLQIIGSNRLGVAMTDGSSYGISAAANGLLSVAKAENSDIDARTQQYKPIVPSTLNYAVTAALTDVNRISLTPAQKAIAPNTLGAAYEPLMLTEAPTSSTPATAVGQFAIDTTNHKVYSCEAITNTGTEETPVYEYAWREHVLLDGDGLVPSAQLPVATSASLGVVIADAVNGVGINNQGKLVISKATDANIAARSSQLLPIVPYNLNSAVTAALTDSRHITLNAPQQSTAQSVLGVGPAPIVQSGAPTVATAGAVGQLYVDTATSKTYHCTAVTVDDTDPQNPVTTYTWTDDVNANGGTFRNSVTITDNYAKLLHGVGTLTVGSYSAAIAAGNASTIYSYALITGRNSIGGDGSQVTAGKYNVEKTGARITGGGSSTNNRLNIEELSWSGDHYIAGGHQQGVTVIPAATTAYTLAEGVQSHTPDSPSTYTLPAVTDATRTHEIILNVRFSATALSADFEDSEGNAIVPMSTPTIVAGTEISYLCEWSALQSKWIIMPVDMGGAQ